MNNKESQLFLEDVLEFGKEYISAGASIKKVEDNLYKLCNAYNFKNIEIYAVTSLIVISLKNNEGEHFTQSIRVKQHSTDLGKLEDISQQFKYIMDNLPNIDKLDELIKNKKPYKPHPIIKCLGYMLAAGGFAVFFGGDILDGIAAAIVGILIYLMDYNLKLKNINGIVYSFTASLVAGLIANIFVHIGFGHNLDKVMIGDIMLLIPGLLLVNSIREMFNRDIVSGVYKFIEAVLMAAAIAGGYALSMIVFGGVWSWVKYLKNH